MPNVTARPNRTEWGCGRSSTFWTFWKPQPPRTIEHTPNEKQKIIAELEAKYHHTREVRAQDEFAT